MVSIFTKNTNKNTLLKNYDVLLKERIYKFKFVEDL
ncbi:hypothetical protein BXY80_2121 [Ichthyenterobacterium magnum]|uniref:Uncharacterized protein n=1 Tax=Ichthyenterobacterium magnum TaxID=1230530 RepID=A0A420DGJ2_9FLAO|nr:hypothetical protein BXY80_2121 [Ichthyenterobacterium magnum]